jgi:hypothetical protein
MSGVENRRRNSSSPRWHAYALLSQSAPQSGVAWLCCLFPLIGRVGAGARTVGAGGNSITFAMDRSPAGHGHVSSSRHVKRSVRFSAVRFPVGFMPGVMGPIMLGVLSARVNDELDTHQIA